MKGALVLLVCLITGLDTSVADFISTLGNEIYKQLENAWNVLKRLVKRPARGKNKEVTHSKQTEPPEDSMTEIEMTEKNTSPKASIPSFLYYFHRKQRKIILPVIKGPVWRTRDGWYQEQQPDLRFHRRRDFFQNANFEGDDMYTVAVNYGDKTTKEQIDPEAEEDEDIGVMMFI